MTNHMYEQLSKQVQYAKNSFSKELLYEANGAIKMARQLAVITLDEYLSLNHECVYDGLNSPALIKEWNRRHHHG
jgi:hypothetical protein